MGEGKPKEELSDDDIDALKETMNQVNGSTVQQVTNLFGKKAVCSPVELAIADASQQKEELAKIFGDNEVYAFTHTLQIEDIIAAKIHFCINAGAKEYMEGFAAPPPTTESVTAIIKEPDSEVTTVDTQLEEFASHQEISVEDDRPEMRNVNLIKGIEVNVKIKLGETRMPLKKITKLAPGTIIELNKDVESLLELVVNDKTIAQGVLVVVSSNNFGLRVTKIIEKAERIKRLGGGDED